MSTADLLKDADREIRALARKTGLERRQIIEALEDRIRWPEAAHQPLGRRSAPVAEPRQNRFTPAPKEAPRRSEPYRRWVASLPCMHCGREGPSQCAHGDAGKGLSIKAGDDTCYPLCADQPGQIGCHTFIGAKGVLSRAGRRELECTYAQETQRLARETGHWPKDWDW